MKSRVMLFILVSFYMVPSFAQQGYITCSTDRNADNSLSIFSECQAYGEYTIKLNFSLLAGYTTNLTVSRNIALATVERGKRELAKFTQTRNAGLYSFQYTYQYFPGKALRKAPDTSFVYLLPTNSGNYLRISKVSSIEERLGQKREDEFYATGFVYKLGDTICASRAGIIYDCNGMVSEGEKSTEFYKRERNKISIQHKDGSLGAYSILAPIKLLVGLGDYVVPGQALAVFNKESEKYLVLFSTYYLDEKKLLTENNISKIPAPSYFAYIPAHFYAGENEKSISLELNKQYAVQQPKEIIAAELSKKDKKRLGFQ